MASSLNPIARAYPGTTKVTMTRSKFFLAAALGIMLLVPSLWAQDAKDKKSVDILKGPATAKVGAVAQIEVPAGYAFLDGKTTRALLKASGEPTSGNEVGFLRPTNAHWSVIFEFSSIGYVKDDDKDKLDANKLLKSYQDGTAEANKAREAAGNPHKNNIMNTSLKNHFQREELL